MGSRQKKIGWTLAHPETGVAYKVQSDDIIIALAGIELDGKATRVARQVRELSTQGDRREADKDWRFDAR